EFQAVQIRTGQFERSAIRPNGIFGKLFTTSANGPIEKSFQVCDKLVGGLRSSGSGIEGRQENISQRSDAFFSLVLAVYSREFMILVNESWLTIFDDLDTILQQPVVPVLPNGPSLHAGLPAVPIIPGVGIIGYTKSRKPALLL